MKIGELAAATGTPIETIRYYERAGLLAPPERSGGNYRLYGEAQAERLAFIRHCRALDMNLDEIRVLLRFMDAPQDNCGEVDRLLDEHIEHVSHRMRELRSLEKALRRLREQCRGADDAGRCGILAGLSTAARASAPRSASHVGQVHGALSGKRPARVPKPPSRSR